MSSFDMMPWPAGWTVGDPCDVQSLQYNQEQQHNITTTRTNSCHNNTIPRVTGFTISFYLGDYFLCFL
jgi:hypothetical protein